MSYECYERIKKLGQGSFGAVYLVRDRRDGNSYVMKEVDLSTMGPQGRREALKEVGFLSKLSHPAIIGYREWFERSTGGKKILYIVMEYADGGDLSTLIKNRRGRNIPEEQITYYMVQMLLALLHMHSNHVMHRDIKAENVFLTRNNYVKIGDFGISKSLASTLAQARTRIGTPYYLSPEICLDRPYDTKNDMWALGVVMYQLCSLKHPFDANSMENLLHAIVHSKHRPLSSHYSKPLRDLIDTLLAKKAAHRPSVVKVLALPWVKEKVNAYLECKHHTPEYVAAVHKAWEGAQAHHGGQSLGNERDKDVEPATRGVGAGPIAEGVVQTDEPAPTPSVSRGGYVVEVNGRAEEFGSYEARMREREREVGLRSEDGDSAAHRLRPSQQQQQQQLQQQLSGLPGVFQHPSGANAAGNNAGNGMGNGAYPPSSYGTPAPAQPQQRLSPQRPLFHGAASPSQPRTHAQQHGSAPYAQPGYNGNGNGSYPSSQPGSAAPTPGRSPAYPHRGAPTPSRPVPTPGASAERGNSAGYRQGSGSGSGDAYGRRGRDLGECTPQEARAQLQYMNRSGSAMAAILGGYPDNSNRSGSGSGKSSVPSLPPINRRHTPSTPLPNGVNNMMPPPRAVPPRPTQLQGSGGNGSEAAGAGNGRYVPVKPRLPPRPQPQVQRASRPKGWK